MVILNSFVINSEQHGWHVRASGKYSRVRSEKRYGRYGHGRRYGHGYGYGDGRRKSAEAGRQDGSQTGPNGLPAGSNAATVGHAVDRQRQRGSGPKGHDDGRGQNEHGPERSGPRADG